MLKDFQNVIYVLGHPIHVTQLLSVHSNEIFKTNLFKIAQISHLYKI